MQRDGLQFIWYLSDSGYSRVVWHEESGNLALTDNSRREVKANWEAALPQRQAVENELKAQWRALGGVQEAEDPKSFLKHHAPHTLADGQYTVSVQFKDELVEDEAYVEDGWLYFQDAPYGIGQYVHKRIPAADDDAFHEAVGAYTSAIEQAAAEGRTCGTAEGIVGIAPFRIDLLGPLEYADGGNADIQVEALCLVENVLNESPELKTLKARRRSLNPAEKRQAGDAPIWKANVNGKTWYVCNTHRAYQARPTVKGAAHAWHHGVEQSG